MAIPLSAHLNSNLFDDYIERAQQHASMLKETQSVSTSANICREHTASVQMQRGRTLILVLLKKENLEATAAAAAAVAVYSGNHLLFILLRLETKT